MIRFLQSEFLPVSPTRQAIRDTHHLTESEVVHRLLAEASRQTVNRDDVQSTAEQLIVAIREEQSGKGGVDALLKEFSLSTEEGVVLMCLAEALLRVPDNETADDLIRDKLMSGDWASHLGKSESLFVNASAWGLLMTGKVTRFSSLDYSDHLMQRTIGRLGEPVIRHAMKTAMEIMGTQFVLGTTIQQALKRARSMEEAGYGYSFDMLGEGARTESDAARYLESYEGAIKAIGAQQLSGRTPGISVKLSALHPRYEPHKDLTLLTERVVGLAELAATFDIGFTVDAEEADRLDISLGVIETIIRSPLTKNWRGFGIAVQAYQKRAPEVLDWISSLARELEIQINVRLVKGAYWDSEVKWAQQAGLFDYPVFTRKVNTDLCYQVCAEKLIEARPNLYPQFATHNAHTVAMVLALAEQTDQALSGFEFQRLHGMGESLYESLRKSHPVDCRIYAPVGEHAELLAYLVRRLLENGANSSFVNNIVDETIPIEKLVEDPREVVLRLDEIRSTYIPLPKDLYRMSAREPGGRANAAGVDLADESQLATLKQQMEYFWSGRKPDETGEPVLNPATGDVIGHIHYATADEMLAQLNTLNAEWARQPQHERTAMIENLADILEDNLPELCAYCMTEAGKTLDDSVAEVREAVDFCRYYAQQSRFGQSGFSQSGLSQSSSNLSKPHFSKPHFSKPLGTVLCISPWNFPVAIFIGQIVAALSVGNSVIGKPAEQTSLVAQHLRDLIYRAGIPETAFQLVVAEGEAVGGTLVPHPKIAGVMFTGSDVVARFINRSLHPGVPLVAETGGQNAMIVDSTALFEQVVDDVILSGFNSAGQRCSALRVLYLQSDVADRLIHMIQGAMACLQVGDPALLSTDVGPVIDEAARGKLNSHIQQLSGLNQGRLIFQSEVPEVGCFFPPTLVELESAAQLTEEVFGPVVHVIRFERSDIDRVIDDINESGFGLTFGVHSRIAEVAERCARRVSVGNVYVNRNMVGAVVGVQPFGGRGRSGTGPKAGGPNYLSRLVEVSAGDVALNKTFNPESRNPTEFDPGGHVTPAFSFKEREAELLPQLNLLPDETLRACSEVNAIAKGLLGQTHALPGPTGEDDQLVYEPRGLVALLPIEDANEWWLRVIATLITGNTPILIDPLGKLVSGLEQRAYIADESQAAAILNHPELKGVLGGLSSNAWCEKVLKLRPGAILPFVTKNDPEALVQHLLFEKVISTDTTAAGGNATLLNASGRDEGIKPLHSF